MTTTCELCGREIKGVPYSLTIDHVKVIVCKSCANKYKDAQPLRKSTPRSLPIKQRIFTPTVRPPRELRYTVVDDYAQLIREAREMLGLTREVLARMVGEKESVIKKIEDGRLIPSIDLARKLERVLKINLVIEETTEEELYTYETPHHTYELTLGDIVEIKKPKEKTR